MLSRLRSWWTVSLQAQETNEKCLLCQLLVTWAHLRTYVCSGWINLHWMASREKEQVKVLAMPLRPPYSHFPLNARPSTTTTSPFSANESHLQAHTRGMSDPLHQTSMSPSCNLCPIIHFQPDFFEHMNLYNEACKCFYRNRGNGEILHAHNKGFKNVFIFYCEILVFLRWRVKRSQAAVLVRHMVPACEVLEEAAAGLKLLVSQSLSHMMPGLWC